MMDTPSWMHRPGSDSIHKPFHSSSRCGSACHFLCPLPPPPATSNYQRLAAASGGAAVPSNLWLIGGGGGVIGLPCRESMRGSLRASRSEQGGEGVHGARGDRGWAGVAARRPSHGRPRHRGTAMPTPRPQPRGSMVAARTRPPRGPTWPHSDGPEPPGAARSPGGLGESPATSSVARPAVPPRVRSARCTCEYTRRLLAKPAERDRVSTSRVALTPRCAPRPIGPRAPRPAPPRRGPEGGRRGSAMTNRDGSAGSAAQLWPLAARRCSHERNQPRTPSTINRSSLSLPAKETRWGD